MVTCANIFNRTYSEIFFCFVFKKINLKMEMGVVPCVAYKTYTVVTLVDIPGLKILKKDSF